MAEQDGLDCQVIIEQEPGASGIQLIAHYTNNVLPGYKVVASRASTNKVTRAVPFLAACEAGKVSLLKRKWNKIWISEFEDFPDALHDDQVDTSAIGYNVLLGKKHHSPVWGRTLPQALTVKEQEEAAAPVTGATWGKRRK